MALQAQPPYKHSVRLKGDLVKHWAHKTLDGNMISLHHGTEVYKVFIPAEVQKFDATAELVGGKVELWANKDRKVGGWIARTGVVRSPAAT